MKRHTGGDGGVQLLCLSVHSQTGAVNVTLILLLQNLLIDDSTLMTSSPDDQLPPLSNDAPDVWPHTRTFVNMEGIKLLPYTFIICVFFCIIVVMKSNSWGGGIMNTQF